VIRRGTALGLLALVLLAGVYGGAATPDAEAHRLSACRYASYSAGTDWCHLHTRYYYFFNEAYGRRFDVARDAQIDWHQETTLDLSSTDHASRASTTTTTSSMTHRCTATR
jgi:hypothetical protein